MSDDRITLKFYLDDLDISEGVARYRMPVEHAREWALGLLRACDGPPPVVLPLPSDE